MRWLHNERKNISAYHAWNDEDQNTACKMWAAGGMRQDKPGYVLVDEPPATKWLCTMCQNNLIKD